MAVELQWGLAPGFVDFLELFPYQGAGQFLTADGLW